MMRLRGHHLFCATLFQGRGYDESFVARMQETLVSLERGEPFTLCQEGDVLCDACPNRTEVGCSLGTEDVLRRDQAALAAVGLSSGQELCFDQVGRLLKTVTQDGYHSVCGGCRWQKEGLCSWELFQKAVQKGFG
ncbi:MAG: DUF1284 domain-containing protein [Acutalibacter sp.]|jgi:hypothetical protein